MSDTIKILFSDNLTKLTERDKKLIESGIMEWVYGEIDTKSEYKLAVAANQWTIKIMESAESNQEEFKSLVSEFDKLNSNIPHGLTNLVTKTVFVFIPNQSGDLAVRQAFDAISHELCHMLVMILVELGKLEKRTIRSYPDKNVGAGTEGNTWTVLVHDRDYEDSHGLRKRKTYTIKKYNLGPFVIKYMQLSGIDVTDVINNAFKI